MTEKTGTRDALGNEISLGQLYGYSVDNSGHTHTVIGKSQKFTATGKLTIEVIFSKSALWMGESKENPWIEKGKKVSVKPSKCFPVYEEDIAHYLIESEVDIPKEYQLEMEKPIDSLANDFNYTNEELAVRYNGNLVCVLNPYLINKMKIDRETLEKLKLTHIERAKIFAAMEATDDVFGLKYLAEEFDKLEFKQQALWGWPQDANMHRWFDVPKCTCPKTDNAERLGTKYRIIAEDCPIHGTNEN